MDAKNEVVKILKGLGRPNVAMVPPVRPKVIEIPKVFRSIAVTSTTDRTE